MRNCFFALIALALAGCGTAAQKTEFNNSAVINNKKDAVWEKLLEYFTRNNIQIKTIEKVSGVIYAERASFEANMANCGEAPLWVETGRSATLNVFVRPQGAGTNVTVNTTFAIIRTFDNKSQRFECFSTGVLERSILSALN